jgi:arylsulfatase A-like enzyme
VRSVFTRFVPLTACLLLSSIVMAQAPTPSKRPNIIVIMSDDMGYSDLGAYGSEIETPNLDKLAAEGLRFRQFYNTARCCPTRASLLTGLYSHQAGVGHMTQNRGLPAYNGELNDRCATIAEVLKPSGYSTYAVGKWHVARSAKPDGPKYDWPTQRGFEHYYGIIGGAANYFHPNTLTRDNTRIQAATDTEYKPTRPYYFTDAVSDNAIRFAEESKKNSPDKPFFMYVAYTAAHWPMQAPAPAIAKYKGKYDVGYEPIRKARLEKMKKLGLIDASWTPAPPVGDWDKVPDKQWEARCMEVYAAMVTRMDEGIGRLVAELKKNGQYDNTLILFLQDNGACAEDMGRKNPAQRAKLPGGPNTNVAYGENWAHVSNTPFRLYKHWEHEGGISTPLIAHWPAVIQGSRQGTLVKGPGHLIDIMATCVDLAKASYPKQRDGKDIPAMEGVSLRPILEKSEDLKRAHLLFWEHEGNRAVRDGKWKLSYEQRLKVWELYDTDADRTEMHDLAAAQPDRVKSMAAQWDVWAKRVGVVPWPLPAPVGVATTPEAEEK